MQNHISYIKLNRRWDYFRHWKIREKKPRFFGGLTYYLRSRCQLDNRFIYVNFEQIFVHKKLIFQGDDKKDTDRIVIDIAKPKTVALN